MINDTQTQLSNEVVESLLLDVLNDRQLNTIVQKYGSLEKVEIEIKISQQGKELFLARRRQFEAPCPCNQHSTAMCTHSVDAAGNPICS